MLVLDFTSPAKLLITGATECGLLQGQRLRRWLRNDLKEIWLVENVWRVFH